MGEFSDKPSEDGDGSAANRKSYDWKRAVAIIAGAALAVFIATKIWP